MLVTMTECHGSLILPNSIMLWVTSRLGTNACEARCSRPGCHQTALISYVFHIMKLSIYLHDWVTFVCVLYVYSVVYSDNILLIDHGSQ